MDFLYFKPHRSEAKIVDLSSRTTYIESPSRGCLSYPSSRNSFMYPGMNTSVGIVVALAGAAVSDAIGSCVAGTPHAERRKIIRMTGKDFFKPILLVSGRTYPGY